MGFKHPKGKEKWEHHKKKNRKLVKLLGNVSQEDLLTVGSN